MGLTFPIRCNRASLKTALRRVTLSQRRAVGCFERLIPSREIACWRKSDSISPQDGAAQQRDEWDRGIALRQAPYRYLDHLALCEARMLRSRMRQTQKTRRGAGCSLRVKNVQTTRRPGAIAVIGLKAVVKKLLYISPI